MTPDASFGERELLVLGREECLGLLHFEVVGRLAYCPAAGSAPDVLPVNFVLDHDEPVFRTHDGYSLDRMLDRPVSLQVDRFDWFHHSGWSVLVQGSAVLVEPGSLEELELDTWAPGPQRHLVRIVPEHLSGRRIELHQRPLDPEGYL